MHNLGVLIVGLVKVPACRLVNDSVIFQHDMFAWKQDCLHYFDVYYCKFCLNIFGSWIFGIVPFVSKFRNIVCGQVLAVTRSTSSVDLSVVYLVFQRRERLINGPSKRKVYKGVSLVMPCGYFLVCWITMVAFHSALGFSVF